MGERITWISYATPDVTYQKDLDRLKASTRRLGEGHVFEYPQPKTTEVTFRHTIKFDLLREALKTCKTPYLAWVDADCQFLQPIPPEDFTDCTYPLFTVRHFAFSDVRKYLPFRLHHRLPAVIPTGISWQSCIFGGEVEALAKQLNRLEWMAEENETYEEFGLVLDWAARPDEVFTLPCRYAAPTSFERWPKDWRKRYDEFAGGFPLILHHNRASY